MESQSGSLAKEMIMTPWQYLRETLQYTTNTIHTLWKHMWQTHMWLNHTLQTWCCWCSHMVCGYCLVLVWAVANVQIKKWAELTGKWKEACVCVCVFVYVELPSWRLMCLSPTHSSTSLYIIRLHHQLTSSQNGSEYDVSILSIMVHTPRHVS